MKSTAKNSRRSNPQDTARDLKNSLMADLANNCPQAERFALIELPGQGITIHQSRGGALEHALFRLEAQQLVKQVGQLFQLFPGESGSITGTAPGILLAFQETLGPSEYFHIVPVHQVRLDTI